MIKLKELLYESRFESAETVNKRIYTDAKRLIPTFIKGNMFGQQTKVINIFKRFSDEMVSKSDLIIKYFKEGNGTDIANMYLNSFKNLVYNEINDMSGITKTAIRNFINIDDFKKNIESYHDDLNSLYDNIFYSTLMSMHDPDNPREQKALDSLYKIFNTRRDNYIQHIINWSIEQIYNEK